MNNDHAMAIVCDLALCIGREVTLDALLTKVEALKEDVEDLTAEARVASDKRKGAKGKAEA